MRTRTALSLLLCGSFLTHPYAAERAHWLSHGPGTAAAAMGGAFTGNANDASAIYYNPASLRYLGGTVMAEHVPVYGGGRYNFIAAHYPVSRASFGLGLVQTAIGDIEGRSTPADQPTELKTTQSAFYFPIATFIGDYSIGSNLTLLRYDLAGYKDSGFGFDAAVARRWMLPFGKLSFNSGFVVRNLVEPSVRLVSETEKLPRTYVLGLSVSKNLFSSYRQALDAKVWDRITVNLDLTRNIDGTDTAIGAEYFWRGGVRFRGGFGDDFTMGMAYGPPLGSFEIGYAFLFTETLPTHRMSFSYKFSDPIRFEENRLVYEVDYTDPTIELESAFRSLADHNRSRVNNLVQGIGGHLQTADVYRWLVSDPENQDAWSLYRSIGGQETIRAKVPTNPRIRKEYLAFVVAYCNREPGAGMKGVQFVERYGSTGAGRLVKLVLEQPGTKRR